MMPLAFQCRFGRVAHLLSQIATHSRSAIMTIDGCDVEAKESLLVEAERDSFQNHRSGSRTQLLKQLRSIIPVFAIALSIGVVIGFLLRPFDSPAGRKIPSGLPAPAGFIHEVWQHNVTFSQKPCPESEAAWDSLVPTGRGFVHHEPEAPFISNIAVFHQLHCLVGIDPDALLCVPFMTDWLADA